MEDPVHRSKISIATLAGIKAAPLEVMGREPSPPPLPWLVSKRVEFTGIDAGDADNMGLRFGGRHSRERGI